MYILGFVKDTKRYSEGSFHNIGSKFSMKYREKQEQKSYLEK